MRRKEQNEHRGHTAFKWAEPDLNGAAASHKGGRVLQASQASKGKEKQKENKGRQTVDK